MPDLLLWFWTAFGIFLSFIVPPLTKTARSEDTASVQAIGSTLRRLITNRYFAITLLSVLASLLVLALLQDEITSWNTALINGAGWHSALARVFSADEE